jgi:translation initiation factor 2B subunit (eIF-2B alpha/beta/delta family)
MEPATFRAIELIAADHTAGAASLTRRAADILAAATASDRDEAGRLLIAAQPAMVSIFNLVEHVRAGGSPAAFIERMESSARQAARIASAMIGGGDVVMTHSSSAAVFDTLMAAHSSGRRFRVIATESRPMREGVGLARALSQAGVDVTLIVDAAAGRFIPGTSLILLGADSVGSEGVVNKIGSLLIALAARECGRAVYAVCASDKLRPPGWTLPQEAPKDSAEVEPHLPCANYYFELVPLHLFKGVITEAGVLDRSAFIKGGVHP